MSYANFGVLGGPRGGVSLFLLISPYASPPPSISLVVAGIMINSEVPVRAQHEHDEVVRPGIELIAWTQLLPFGSSVSKKIVSLQSYLYRTIVGGLSFLRGAGP